MAYISKTKQQNPIVSGYFLFLEILLHNLFKYESQAVSLVTKTPLTRQSTGKMHSPGQSTCHTAVPEWWASAHEHVYVSVCAHV